MKRLSLAMAILAAVALPVAAGTAESPAPGASEADSAATAVAGALRADRAAAWENVTVPVRVTVDLPKGPVSLAGKMTMVRDKSIYVSLKFWGFEIAQLNVAGDSAVAVMKRPDKVYVCERTGALMRGLNLGVGALQDMVMGRVPCAGDSLTAVFDEASQTWAVEPAVQNAAYDVSFSAAQLAGGALFVTAAAVTPAGCAEAVCRYSEPVECARGVFPGYAEIECSLRGRRCVLSLETQWSKAKWNQDTGVPAFKTDLSSYRRMGLSRLAAIIASGV